MVYWQWIGSSGMSLLAVFGLALVVFRGLPDGAILLFPIAGLIQFAYLKCRFAKDYVFPEIFKVCEIRFLIAMVAFYLTMLVVPALLLLNIVPKDNGKMWSFITHGFMLLWFTYLFLLLPADALVTFPQKEKDAMCFFALVIGHYGFAICLPVYFIYRKKTNTFTKWFVCLATLLFVILLPILIIETEILVNKID